MSPRKRRVDHAIAEGRIWKKVIRPTSWRPTNPNSELVGRFLGIVSKNGSYGFYRCLSLQTDPGGVVYHVSGAMIMDLLDGLGHVELGTALRVVFKGTDRTGTGHTMKLFELYVEEKRS